MFRPIESLIALTLLVTPVLSGCETPCNALADVICECEPNAAEEDVCKLRIDIASDRAVSDAENEMCSMRLETCTCEALENDDLAACGLAKPQE